jgi:YD repeat-containing protein
MFADFHVAEYQSDGSQVNYTFHKEDESLLVDEFDGDSAIYYPLDKGSYSTEGDAKSTLTRVSKEEYRISHPHGMTYIFKGYQAPWRENADPAAGKLIAVKNKKGEQLTLKYDTEGRLTKVSIPDGRFVSFGYNGKFISTMTDTIGRVTSFSYENNELRKVTYPDGTSESFTYDHNHRILSISHSTTGTKTFTYNGDKIASIHHEGTLFSSYVYGEGKVTEKDALGKETIYTYNADNLVTKKVDALGNTFSYEYDGQKRLTKVSNAKDHHSV